MVRREQGNPKATDTREGREASPDVMASRNYMLAPEQDQELETALKQNVRGSSDNLRRVG